MTNNINQIQNELDLMTKSIKTKLENKKQTNNENKQAEIVTEPFLTKRTWYRKLFEYLIGEITITPEKLSRQSPIMLYIDEEGEIKTFKNVSTGVIHPKNKWGQRKNYHNLIEARKVLNWNYGGARIKMYIHHEKELYAYPHEPKLDALQTVKALKIIQANYKEYDLRDAKMTKDQVIVWLYLVGGLVAIVLLGLWLYNNFDIGQAFGAGKQVVGQVVSTPPAPTTPPPAVLP